MRPNVTVNSKRIYEFKANIGYLIMWSIDVESEVKSTNET